MNKNIDFNKVDDIFRKTGFSKEIVILVIPHLMEHVETYKDMSGREKKQLVVELIKYGINKFIPNKNDQHSVSAIINNVIDPAIDTYVAMSKGEFKLNLSTSMFKCFCC